MDHNHHPLIYGYLLTFGLFGLGAVMGMYSVNAVDWQSRVMVQVIAGFMIVASIIMLREIFNKRDQCSICKPKQKQKES